ncbi:hypothetical protein AK812_SmicGene21834 [Symbiodinium microadriaticum]|uniref:Uncharacterized protein n=1 Tax=Symbiodinium microadriaticum TaxID=2951 RepID=A0A1Q9DLL2_SYMMI|nr:hypothetical protein AK812_SmicGene21834 [Symbiodinium microadriaticum]
MVLAERHGAIVKLMMMHMVAAMNLSSLVALRQACLAALAAKNRTVNKGGVSSIDAGGDWAQHYVAMESNEALQRADRIRQGEVEAFHWLDSHEASGKVPRSVEYKITLRGTAQAFPVEKVRLATLNEMVSAQFVNEALEEVEDELQGGRITVEGEAAPQDKYSQDHSTDGGGPAIKDQLTSIYSKFKEVKKALPKPRGGNRTRGGGKAGARAEASRHARGVMVAGEEVTAGEYEAGLTADERRLIGSVVGQLNWAARQGRYDLAFVASFIQQLAGQGKAEALKWLNSDLELTVRKLNCELDELVVLSVSGTMVLFTDPSVLYEQGPVCIMEAASTKIQRVVRCSMSAEVSSLATAFEHGEYVRAVLAELLDPSFRMDRWKLSAAKWRHLLVTDAKTGYDAVASEVLPSDRKIAIDVGSEMPGDGLTKWAHNQVLTRERYVRAWDWEMPDRIKAKAWAAYITAIETDETWGGLTEFRAKKWVIVHYFTGILRKEVPMRGGGGGADVVSDATSVWSRSSAAASSAPTAFCWTAASGKKGGGASADKRSKTPSATSGRRVAPAPTLASAWKRHDVAVFDGRQLGQDLLRPLLGPGLCLVMPARVVPPLRVKAVQDRHREKAHPEVSAKEAYVRRHRCMQILKRFMTAREELAKLQARAHTFQHGIEKEVLAGIVQKAKAMIGGDP